MNKKHTMLTCVLSVLVASSAVGVETKNEEKSELDPTKIVTKAGLSYTDALSVSGSIGLDESRMVNTRVDIETGEWRIGGSWLFDVGIVNFNFSKTDYDHDAYRNNYSIGTFVPLTHFGIEPMGIKIFPTVGLNYNDGEYAQKNEDITLTNEYMLVPSTSKGGYIGAFAMKPITDKWTAMAFGGGAKGSDDYDAYWFGGGAGYKIDGNHSIKAFAFRSDGSFGVEEKVGAAYTYEFD